MARKVNDVVVEVATVNGSGSQSSNNILMRTIFRMGVPVEGKNLFPSNIAGLPTWFTIRVHEEGFLSRRAQADIVIALNAKTLLDDARKVRSGGLFIYNSDLKVDFSKLECEGELVPVSFKPLVSKVTDSIQLKKLLTNMIYVGILVELLELDPEALESAIKDQFKGKEKVFDVNMRSVQEGMDFAKTELAQLKRTHKVEPRSKNNGKLLMDGNSSAALGLVMGGATFMSWYPITPSSSLAESFYEFSSKRDSVDGGYPQALLQAEDELSAISMVLGAGWAGSRAFTTTSGPGLSLMAEAAGLFYFAEIPGVLWDVQRMGPSTGLPTRTSQGDLLAAHFLSHGDTEHIVLLPGSVEECYEFGQISLDLAERYQTLVLVLSDLDLGMNYWITEDLKYPTKKFDRGKVLAKEDLEKLQEFARYKDVDGDGIPYRTLPGTQHDLAAYFTRGTGHTERGTYSEDPGNYERLLDRLKRKIQNSRKDLPAPLLDDKGHSTGIIAFGSTEAAIPELRQDLQNLGTSTDYLRVRALPLSDEVGAFLERHSEVVVIEQNRDSQLLKLISLKFPRSAGKLKSLTTYNGLPVSSEELLKKWVTLKEETPSKEATL